MTRRTLLAVLRALRPEEHGASPDYVRRVRLEWRVLLALERAGHIRPLDGRPWTRAQLLEEAFLSQKRPRLVLVVDHDARGEHDTEA